MHFLTIWPSARANTTHLPAQAVLPTAFDVQPPRFRDPKDGSEHALLTAGDLAAAEAPLVRIHSSSLTGDAFGSLKCDCGLNSNLRCVARRGAGAIVAKKAVASDCTPRFKPTTCKISYDTLDANLALGLPGGDALTRRPPPCQELVHRVRLMTNNATS